MEPTQPAETLLKELGNNRIRFVKEYLEALYINRKEQNVQSDDDPLIGIGRARQLRSMLLDLESAISASNKSN